MTEKLSDFYKQGVVDAVSEFEKTAVFQECMKDSRFREEFSRKLLEKIEERNNLDS